jgi:rod shape-determining protein MreB and related proteins
MLSTLRSYFRADLAVDLGTVNTRIGLVGEGLIVDEPSLVAVDRASGRILSGGAAVGHLARQMQGRTPDGIAVLRPLAHGAVADVELCQAMLACFLRKVQRPGFRLRPRVLVAVPDGLTPVERRAVFSSLARAGAGETYLIPKAKAAAIGVGLPVVEPLASMVCDVGGGTTDLAVISLSDSVAALSIRAGGDKMDEAIVAYVRRNYSLRIGVSTAERLRIAIGSAYPLEEECAEEISGLDTASGLPRKATVTSEEVREALADPLETIVEAVKETVDRCHPEMAADLIDQGLLLGGGGALLRGLDRFLTEQTGIPARLAPEPLAAVVRGALVCLEHFARWRPAFRSSDEW